MLSNYYKSITTTTTDAATNIVLTGSGTGLTLNYNNLLIALGNLQPLNSCLSNLPLNINSTQTSWFTPQFPTDQPLWTTFTSASSANTTNSNVPIYTQTLTFTSSTSQVSLTVNNTFTSASCTVSMDILFGTATSFGWGVYSVGSTGTTNITQDVLSANLPVLATPTAYNTISLAFTSPSGGTFTLRCGPNIASSGASGIGTVSITNVCMYSGTSQIMLCRGSFSAPFGNISANSLTANSIWSYTDVQYNNGNSLMTNLSQLQPLNSTLTAIPNNISVSNPSYIQTPTDIISTTWTLFTSASYTSSGTYQTFTFP